MSRNGRALAALAVLIPLASTPGGAKTTRVVENGTLEIPLRGYPDPPLKPPAPQAAV